MRAAAPVTATPATATPAIAPAIVAPTVTNPTNAVTSLFNLPAQLTPAPGATSRNPLDSLERTPLFSQDVLTWASNEVFGDENEYQGNGDNDNENLSDDKEEKDEWW